MLNILTHTIPNLTCSTPYAVLLLYIFIKSPLHGSGTWSASPDGPFIWSLLAFLSQGFFVLYFEQSPSSADHLPPYVRCTPFLIYPKCINSSQHPTSTLYFLLQFNLRQRISMLLRLSSVQECVLIYEITSDIALITFLNFLYSRGNVFALLLYSWYGDIYLHAITVRLLRSSYLLLDRSSISS